MRPAPHTGFRADVQGLRAIAVLSVVAFHADHALLTGGFVGVDIFFVISGFLISGIIVGGVEKGTFTIAGFYRRRMRRIFPALFVMLAVSAALGYLLLAPAALRELARTTISTIFFISNFDFYKLSGYFEGQSELKPLLHTWSLAVEEQFYIAYPLLVLVALPRLRRHFWAVLLGLAILSFAACLWLTKRDPSLAFFFAPTRAFELLVGAMLSVRLLPPLRSQAAREVVAVGGLVLIAAALLAINAETPFPGSVALVPCLGAAAVIYAGQDGTSATGRLIGTAPFRFFGDLSYSLYLWHWPLLVFARHALLNEMTPWQSAGVVLASVAVASLSYRFVERPFLAEGARPAPVLRLGMASMALGTLVAATILGLHGLPGRFPAQSLKLFAAAEDYNRERGRCHADGDRVIAYAQHCVLGDSAAVPDTVVWGDSHGAEVAAALGEQLQPQRRAVLQITSSACPPALGFNNTGRPLCSRQNEDTYSHLVADGRIRTVVLSAALIGIPPDQWEALTAGYRRAAEGLQAAGKQVVIVDPFPQMAYDPPSALGLEAARGERFEDYGLSRADYDRTAEPALQFLNSVAAQTGAHVIRTEDILCDSHICHAYLPAAGSLYFNAGHLSVAGGRLIVAAAPL